MRILMVSPLDIFPPNTGGMSRIYNMAKYLSRSHVVSLACPPLAHPAAKDLPIDVHAAGAPGRSQFLDPRYVAALRSVIKKTAPDVIISSFCWSIPAVALARGRGRTPIHLETQNVESDRFRRAGSRWWRAMALFERGAVRLSDRVYAVSEADAARLHEIGAAEHKLEVVPNGFDPESFRPDPLAGAAMRTKLGMPESETLFLYFGHLQYAPNIEGLEILQRHVLPKLDETGLRYRVAVAGRGSDALQGRYTHPRLLYLGAVDDIAAVINAAGVVVAPLLRGGGTRVKIIESIACGRPVVSTTLGAEGLDRGACGNLLHVVDGWDAFACAMAKASNRGDSSDSPSTAFRELYAWDSIVRRMQISVSEPIAVGSKV